MMRSRRKDLPLCTADAPDYRHRDIKQHYIVRIFDPDSFSTFALGVFFGNVHHGLCPPTSRRMSNQRTMLAPTASDTVAS